MKTRQAIFLTVLLVTAAVLGGCAAASSSTAPPAQQSALSVNTTTGTNTNTNDASAGGLVDRMIVYTTTLSLVVQNTEEAAAMVTEIARRAGGLVTGIDSRREGDRMLSTMIIKVPAREFEDVIASLHQIGLRVLKESGSAKDVTEEYTDLASRQRNLEATEAQYLTLMKQAQTIDDILKVQQRLTEVRGQIEQAKGRMQLLERTSDLATITVSLVPESIAPSPPGETFLQWEPLRAAAESWNASIVMLQRIAILAIRAVAFFWWLLLPSLLALVWYLQRQERPTPRRGPTPAE